MVKELNHAFFKALFDKGWSGYKSYHYAEAQRRFEIEFSKIGRWGFCSKNNKFGILTDEGFWDAFNRINTHPKICKFFYDECIKHDPNMFIEFGNPTYYKINAKKMWDYLIENFDLYFTKKITDEYYNIIHGYLNNSWQSGNITVLGTVFFIKKHIPNVININYGFETGDVDDMKGIDVSFQTIGNETKTIQVKSGKYTNLDPDFFINGSVNDLKYKTDYYSYCNVSYYYTSIFFFKNDVDGIFRNEIDDRIEVNKDLIVYHKFNENMPIPQTIFSIFKISDKLDKIFTLTKDGDNSVTITDLEVIVNISDLDDPNLETMLDEKLKELEQLLN
jgi:hypothetical protein